MTVLRQRAPRQRNPGYLAWLRLQPCSCGCGSPPPSDAAHIRSGSILHGKEYPGLQAKPSDRWAVPLNRSCHLRQHAFGYERDWWSAHGIDPFTLALRYNERYLSETGKDAAAHTVRRAPERLSESDYGQRQPKPKRSPRTAAGPTQPKQKIMNRSQWPAKGSRKLQGRKFRKGP